jgi:hypothetical protein
MKALDKLGSAALLSLLIGCASATPTPSAPPAPSPAKANSLSGLPRDLVPGPASGSKPAMTNSAHSSGACSGDVKPELVSALSSRAVQSRRCYEKLLRSKPSAQGKYVVSLRVSKRGKVEHARLVTDEVGDAEMASCVLARFRSASYPAPRGGCADINVPLNYEPRRTASN